MRNLRYLVILALILALPFGGCVAAKEGPGMERAPRGALVGTSTHAPAPHTGNEVAAEPVAANCVLPETPSEVAAQNVSTTRPSDDEITRQLRVRLLSDPGLSSSARNIAISTQDGVVTLRGDIPNVRERSQVQAHAYGLRGVARVDNLLHVAE